MPAQNSGHRHVQCARSTLVTVMSCHSAAAIVLRAVEPPVQSGSKSREMCNVTLRARGAKIRKTVSSAPTSAPSWQIRFSARRKNVPGTSGTDSPVPSAQPTIHGSARLSASRTLKRHRCQPVRVGIEQAVDVSVFVPHGIRRIVRRHQPLVFARHELEPLTPAEKTRRVAAPSQHPFAFELRRMHLPSRLCPLHPASR